MIKRLAHCLLLLTFLLQGMAAASANVADGVKSEMQRHCAEQMKAIGTASGMNCCDEHCATTPDCLSACAVPIVVPMEQLFNVEQSRAGEVIAVVSTFFPQRSYAPLYPPPIA